MTLSSVPQFLGGIVVVLGAAKLPWALARAIGQSSDFAELAAGVLLGSSVLGLVDLLFFVSVGAAANVRIFNAADPENRTRLMVGGLLILGLIFAQMGPATGVFDAKLSGAVTLMVMVTIFLDPPLLRALSSPADASWIPPETQGIDEWVSGHRVTSSQADLPGGKVGRGHRPPGGAIRPAAVQPII